MKKCPICDGDNDDSAKRCEYCDYEFTTEIETRGGSANKIDHGEYDTAIESSNKNTSVATKQSKINAYFEDEDAEPENINVLTTNTSIGHNGRSNHVVPILVAIIILLGVGMTVLLLRNHNLKNNTSQKNDEISNDEVIKPVVSEVYNTNANNVMFNESDKLAEADDLTLKESNQFVEVGAGSESSRKVLMNYLPEIYNEMSTDSSVLFENEKFDENSFSICDIDFDGEAELLVKITTGPMAAKALYVYKVDSSGEVVLEEAMSVESVFYKNGLVKCPASHNQGRGTLWPYAVIKYDPSEDKYNAYYSLDSWDKSYYSEGFPDDVDVSSTGVVYYIYNSASGEKLTCDYSDYVKWFNSWNQCSPQLRINYEAYSEDNIRKYNPDWNIVKEAETPVNNSNVRPVLDVDDSVTASYNSDGSIRIEYNEVPMTMTVPSSWAGKFVIRNGSFLARTSYYNKTGGKLIPIVMRDEYNDSGGNGRYIGKAGYKYCFYFYASDLNYDMDNAEEVSEYESLRPDIETVLQSAVCIPYEDKITTDIVNLKPYLTGQISSGGKTIEGYTTDYVCHGAEQSVQWICEDTWHITARRKTSSYGVEWYECWDTDDGDYYGWIDGKFLYFYR